MEGAHVSVLLEESVEALQLKPGMIIVDGTLGGGGHAEHILQKIIPGGLLIGIDKDVQAIDRSRQRLKEYEGKFIIIHDDFKNILKALSQQNIPKVDGAVLDLGVSSYQLDDDYRGFSYSQNARLDMRMNRQDVQSAYEVINGYKENDLARVISEYGEERWAKRIAQFIVKERLIKSVETTFELTEIIKAAIPANARRDGPHPAKRTFQAIRIEVNGELAGLAKAVEDFSQVITSGGRLAVITFHSLEDRIIKQEFKRLEHPCDCPPELPVCVCGKKPSAKVITRKPVLPDIKEVDENHRARSAKLRVLEIL
jgi:16S rRNA (cytosine1402-N4)-methyltransferase